MAWSRGRFWPLGVIGLGGGVTTMSRISSGIGSGAAAAAATGAGGMIYCWAGVAAMGGGGAIGC